MNELIEWIKTLDMNAINGWLVATFGIKLTEIIAICITLIVSRVKKFNYEQKLEIAKLDFTAQEQKALQIYSEKIEQGLEQIRKDILAKCDADAQQRLEAINQIEAETTEAIERVESATTPSFDDLDNQVEANA